MPKLVPPMIREAVAIGDWVVMDTGPELRIRHKHSPDMSPLKHGKCPNCGQSPDGMDLLKLRLWLKDQPKFKGKL